MKKKGRERAMGIDLNKPIVYKHASLRFFEQGERHITRFCPDNVLLLVYEGTLRFSEEGVLREVKAGEYYIQRKNCHQGGQRPSDAPKYLYVHFDGEWTEGGLAERGRFDYAALSPLMERMDAAAHRSEEEGGSYAEREYLLLKLLLSLRETREEDEVAKRLAALVADNLVTISSLSQLCEALHYSKNYVIRLFQGAFGLSPMQYINRERVKRAAYLLESTSKPLKEIAALCGFGDYPYFYKRFFRETGLSPSAWRQKTRQNPLLPS